ncbi:putative multidrug resistance protein MdtD [Escherichia coli]|nr:putative multidrug resistance protein MdtD [Escherichia coli]
MMMPVARLALLRAYPRNELLPVLNFVAMPGLVGPILGPVLWRRAGHLGQTWHWIFLINIPIGIAGLLYARKHMPNFTTARRRFDITGFLLFGLSLVSLLKRNRAIRGKDCRQLDCLDGNCHQHRVTASLYSPCATHAKPINFIRFI